VLDVIAQRKRDADAALKLMRRLLTNQPVTPQSITTDGLRSYKAALDGLHLRHLHRLGRLRENNRAENSLFDDESEKCRGSNQFPQRKDFSRVTPPSTTTFTPSPT
jgi:transposase-like protein